MATTITDNALKDKKFNSDKALSFGFKETAPDQYNFQTTILDNQFNLAIELNSNGDLTTELLDNNGEIYSLHLDPQANGTFVNEVRTAYLEVIYNISSECFDSDVFKTQQVKDITKYIKQKYNSDLEFLWRKFPKNAIWRRPDNNKWFCLTIGINGDKIGLESDADIEIIDLRIDTDDLNQVIDNKVFFPSYHMNKKHWYTVYLDGSLSNAELFKRIDDSYDLAKK
ncbi:MmcQ/YjbR family DNA-binding protein [Companilactobacillus jidongensis]|uniref:MmcQ/YjbR family DNA-binding protein n=1 Tax=Companilactobacillus jidongensis TaxID=2486006 RepID=UPI0013DE2EAF|nr:MmcQ/YjbR family DNA-binding protein [Companilactobacillus jidongensis]